MENLITVIIIAFNPAELLEKCLKSLFNCSSVNPNLMEWIVVDNGSWDGVVEEVILKYPWIKVIRNERNMGFAYAANQAFQISTRKYLLYVNTDVEFLSGAIMRMVEVLEKNPEVALVGPLLLRRDLTIQKSVFPLPFLFYELFKPFFKVWVDLKERLYKEGRWYNVSSIRGACFVVRRESLEEVGGFDEDYFFYLEETDLCYRLMKGGWKIAYVPAAKVIHDGGASVKKAGFDNKKIYRQSLIKYFEKRRPKFEVKILKKYWKLLGKS